MRLTGDDLSKIEKPAKAGFFVGKLPRIGVADGA